MSSHKLSLNIIDTFNEQILIIEDTSIYTSLLAVTCPQLYITVPGFNTSVVIVDEVMTQDFKLRLTACQLELQFKHCDSEMWGLPDGIYPIKYQVSPHEYVYVEYNHMRITKAMNQLKQLYCNLDLADCMPDKFKEDKLSEFALIESYLKAAKYKVEECHEPKKGMTLYNYALKMIKKADCKYC